MNNKMRDEVVYVASGSIEAESVRILLESFGLKAFTNQESAGKTYGLTVGPLGLVEVLVPEDQVEEAKQIIRAMDAGNLEDTQDESEDDSSNP